MGVILYKNGEAKVFNEFSYLHELDNGWSYSPEPESEPKKIDVDTEDVEEVIDDIDEVIEDAEDDIDGLESLKEKLEGITD